MPKIAISRELPYRAQQLFEIAADVERYPDFLPGWKSARILQRKENAYLTDQIIGFGPITQQFTTKTILRPPDEIAVTATEGPFSVFRLNWRFKTTQADRCRVTLDGQIEMRMALLRAVLNQAPNVFADSTLMAFEARARQLYAAAVR